MYVFNDSTNELSRHIRDEVEFEREVRRGSRNNAAKRIQEWLCLHGNQVKIDRNFGPASEAALLRFQDKNGLQTTGFVDEETFEKLIYPMKSVLRQRLDSSIPYNEAILKYADSHISQHPRELGKRNLGPWVRLYMRGKQGRSYPWCAGFVTFLMKQAAESLEIQTPIKGSFSCDALSYQATQENLFISEFDVGPNPIPSGSLFLVRSEDNASDWVHTGLVEDARDDYFFSIEGNTNDEGSREGYEAVRRYRGYKNMDFILMQQL